MDLYLKEVFPKEMPIAKAGIISAKLECAKANTNEEAIKANIFPYLDKLFSSTPLKAYSSRIGETSINRKTYKTLLKLLES